MSTVVSKKAQSKGHLLQRFLSPRTIPMLATVAVCLVLYLVARWRYEGFGTGEVFVNFLVDNAPIGIVAVGMTMVIISGGIDLSVAGVVVLCTVLIAKLITSFHLHPVACWGIVLCVGSGVGFLTGCVVRYFKIEPFIATLAGLFLARGIAYMISNETAIPIEHPFYTLMSGTGIPIGQTWVGLPALVLLAVVAVGLYVTFFTPYGRRLFAIGGNEDAAHLMGLPVGRTKVMVYMVSGFLAALAAIVFTITLPAGDPTGADGWELDAIAASVIGGTLMTGGSGNVFGTLIGVLILGIIKSSLDFANVSSYYMRIVMGGLLLVFVVLQRFLSAGAYRKD